MDQTNFSLRESGLPYARLPHAIIRGGHGMHIIVLLLVVSHAGDGECNASISTLAKESRMSERSIRRSLQYWKTIKISGLEFIFESGKNSGKSNEIKILINYAKSMGGSATQADKVGHTGRGGSATQADKEEPIEEESIKKGEGSELALATPKNLAKTFFGDQTTQDKVMGYFIAKGLPEPALRQEFAKFVAYWTEPNSTGTKQRWQMQKTFEIRRRLVTWVQNASKFSSKQFSQEPKGIRI